MDPKLSERKLTYSPSASNNYATIRRIANACRYISYFIVIQSIPSVIGTIILIFTLIGVMFSSNSREQTTWSYVSCLLGAFSFLVNLLLFVIFRVISEGIFILLDIEANSRQTAITLEKLLRSA